MNDRGERMNQSPMSREKQLRPARGLLARAGLAAGSVAILLLLFEAWLRVWNGGPARPPLMFSPGGNHPRYLFMPDPQQTYRLRPFFEGEMREPYGDLVIPVKINLLGLRDSHDPGPTAAARILGLGDSFTYGE